MGGGDHDFLAPSTLPVEPASQRMTNADFRKLMMTPRAGQTPAPPTPGGVTPGGGAMSGGKSGGATPRSVRMDKGKAEERRKKKTYYAKLKKDEDDKMAELAEKYRDRARERRDGGEGVVGEESTNAYRAVAPNARETHDAAERRRQMIHESKYLGGDMEHTHLVKGLDFALLQKVRSEIETREEQIEEEEIENEEDEEEKEVEKKVETKKETEQKKDEPEDDKPAIECRTAMGKNIMRLMFKPEGPKVNELFMAGRMAYVMDLEDENETDIPTTSIRSKQDVINNEQKATVSTNDIVINKLTQILSYLRAGNRTKKKKKDKMGDILGVEEIGKDGNAVGGKVVDNMPIYDDVGDYKPKKDDKREEKRDRRDDRRDKDRGRDGEKRRDDRRDRDRERDKHREGKDRDRERWDRGEDRYRKEQEVASKKQTYFDKPEEPRAKEQRGFSAEDKEMIKALMKKEEEKEKQKDDKKLAGMMQSSNHDGYAECYPGLAEMDDAIGDSDEEADFSKMDMGNKKGPVGRWDFDTAEEYADYMGSKEAMPKAAFQYGMKMSDGRKTRGKVGAKNEKAKLDKEWNQISALIDKRKSGGGGGGSSKKQKYDYE
eukprot:GFUD01033034.1.p1 GENE.GFUD01033034.1~~GFUD01033034.1.p1  ORF type:complete len:603 (+),score=272.53 GFUD01033034.1:57-1865(+)